MLKQKEEEKENKLLGEKVGVLSDVLIGSSKVNWEYVKQAYDLFEKEKIEEVVISGGLFDLNQYICQKDTNALKVYLQKQVEDFQKYYPEFGKLHILLKNEPYYFQKAGLSVMKELLKRNKAISSLGAGTSIISWKEVQVGLRTKIKGESSQLPPEYSFLLEGGAFYYDYKQERNAIKVPTISNYHPHGNKNNHASGFLILKQDSKRVVAERFSFLDNTPKRALKKVLVKKTLE